MGVWAGWFTCNQANGFKGILLESRVLSRKSADFAAQANKANILARPAANDGINALDKDLMVNAFLGL
jgi:ribose 5-phosphate isomerase RpiB